MDFELTSEERALGARARALADGVFRDRAARWDEDEAYPWDNVKDLVRAGCMGITIPRAPAGRARRPARPGGGGGAASATAPASASGSAIGPWGSAGFPRGGSTSIGAA